MPDKISTAVDRLNKILPLKSRQEKLTPELQNLYRNILDAYIHLGRSLNKKEIAQQVKNAEEARNILQQNDMVIFNTDGEVTGTYPFTMEKRDYKISVNNHCLYSMCALDSLAISPMYDVEVQIASHCHITGLPIEIHQQGTNILDPQNTHDIYFGINWNETSENATCANSLCTKMIFLKKETVAFDWLHAQPDQREIFTLDEAVKFSTDFFTPLLD